MKLLDAISLKLGALNVSKVMLGATQVWPNPDPAVRAFTNAVVAGGTSLTSTQNSAISTLVSDLKTAGVWSKFAAIYPVIGGTSSAHSLNLIDPAQYQLTFSGSPTHSANGVQFNGSSYADTGIVPSAVMTTAAGGLSYYSRSDVGSDWEMGAQDPGSNSMGILTKYLYNYLFYCCYGTSSFVVNVYNPDGRGHYVVNRDGSNTEGYKNGSLVVTGNDFTGLAAFSIFIGAANSAGTPAAYSLTECAFASVQTDSLTASEAASFYTAVQNYQTTLSRQV